MIIGRVVDRIFGPKKYYVCVVGDETDPSNQDLMAQVLHDFKSDLDGVPVATEKLNDYGDPDKADRLADDLQDRSDVLMVVGRLTHNLSTRPSTLPAIRPTGTCHLDYGNESRAVQSTRSH
jgi:hypothetical protein